MGWVSLASGMVFFGGMNPLRDAWPARHTMNTIKYVYIREEIEYDSHDTLCPILSCLELL